MLFDVVYVQNTQLHRSRMDLEAETEHLLTLPHTPTVGVCGRAWECVGELWECVGELWECVGELWECCVPSGNRSFSILNANGHEEFELTTQQNME